MGHYIDANKLLAEIEQKISICEKQRSDAIEIECYNLADHASARIGELHVIQETIASLQQEQPVNMIQWTGSNLQEVINFTGKSPKFGEWFKSWDELESYVHSHGDILKLFSDDGSHFEVPVGAWIVKTPDGYNVPSVARFIQAKQEQPQLPGIEDPGIPGKDFIPVEWVDACEMYGKWKIVKREQPEVDLEKEIKNYLATKCAGDDEPSVSEIARHFAEWGAIHLNAKNE